MIELTIIAIILIIIIDFSGIVSTLQDLLELCLTVIGAERLKNIWKTAGRPIKPFSCTFCCIFWTTLAYFLMYESNLYLLLYGIILAYFSDTISYLFLIIKAIIQKILQYIENEILY